MDVLQVMSQRDEEPSGDNRITSSRPKSAKQIEEFRDDVRLNLLGAFDTSKLQSAFDALFEIIGSQQVVLDRLDREMAVMRRRELDRDASEQAIRDELDRVGSKQTSMDNNKWLGMLERGDPAEFLKFLGTAGAAAIAEFLKHGDEAMLARFFTKDEANTFMTGQALEMRNAAELSLRRQVSDSKDKAGDDGSDGERVRIIDRPVEKPLTAEQLLGLLSTSDASATIARNVLMEELKLDMKFNTDINPHGEDGQTVCKIVANRLDEIGRMRSSEDTPRRVSGQEMLDALQAELLAQSTTCEEDRQTVVAFMGRRFLSDRAGASDRYQMGSWRDYQPPPQTDINEGAVAPGDDKGVVEEVAEEPPDNAENANDADKATKEVEKPPADARSFDLTGSWDSFAEKEIRRLNEGMNVLARRGDETSTSVGSVKDALFGHDGVVNSLLSTSTKVGDLERQLSEMRADALRREEEQALRNRRAAESGNGIVVEKEIIEVVRSVDVDPAAVKAIMEADLANIRQLISQLTESTVGKESLKDMLRVGGVDGQTRLPWGPIASAGVLEGHLRSMMVNTVTDLLPSREEVVLAAPAVGQTTVLDLGAEAEERRKVDELSVSMEILRERLEKVAKADEHYRGLIINDLEDLRTRVGDGPTEPHETKVIVQSGWNGPTNDGADDLMKVTDTVRRLNREQMAALAGFVGEVRKLQSDLELRPSEDKIRGIIENMDAVFKQNMGQNLLGLRLTVGEVAQMVQDKASKQDVFQMLLESMKFKEDSEEGKMVAGMVKCISCGYNYAPKGKGNKTSHGQRGKGGFGVGHMYDYYGGVPGSSSTSIASQESPGTALETLDDGVQQQTRRRQQQQAFLRPNTTHRTTTASSVHSGSPSQYSVASPYSTQSALYALSPSSQNRSMLNGLTSEEYNRQEAEAFLTVLRRQGGLQPVSRQSQPMSTKANPYGTNPGAGAGTGAGAAGKGSSTIGNIPGPGVHANEPLFRKARLAQHLKEMVKVPLNTVGSDKWGGVNGNGNGNGNSSGYSGGYGSGPGPGNSSDFTAAVHSAPGSIQSHSPNGGGIYSPPNFSPSAGGMYSPGSATSPMGAIRVPTTGMGSKGAR